ncbi:MAG: TonB-dependent receptor [Terriglobia bacterium]
MLFLSFFVAMQLVAAAPQHYRISGTVRDQSGTAISGAEITLKSGTFAAQRVTDSEGRFEFADVPAEPGTIAVRAEGFGPVEQKWLAPGGEVKPLDIVLQPAPQFQRVSVTATRTQVRLGDTPASVLVLSSTDLQNTSALALDDKLRQVPGFSLFRRSSSRTANPTSQGFSLRGVGASGASRGLVLMDGIPLNDPFGGWIYWDRIPYESVSSVEVLNGGASDLYGTDAMGGVINVMPRRPLDSSLSLETSFGNEETPEISAQGSVRAGRWLGTASGEAYRSDGYILVDKAERGSVDTRANSEYYTLNSNVTCLISDQARGFASGSIFGESRQNGTPLTPNSTHLRQLAAGLDYQSVGAGAIELRVYGGPQLLDQKFSSVATDRNSESLTRVQRVPVEDMGGSAQWSRTVGAWQTLVAGFEAREVRGASNEFAMSKNIATTAIDAGGRERTEGLFGEDVIRPGARWLITAGGRFDHWRNYDALMATQPLTKPGPEAVVDFPERTESAFSPRVSALYRASDKLSLTASGYRAFRAPALNELYRSFRQGNVQTLANANLVAERLTGGEAGARYTAVGSRLELRGTLFWSDISNPVSNVTVSVTNSLITRQRENLGRTRSRGFELDADARVSSHFSLSGGYQYVDASVLSFPADIALVGLRIPQVPRNAFTFQARYFAPSRVTVAIQGRFGGVQYDDDLNQFPLGRYFTLDALISRPLGHRTEIFAAVENLFNDRYAIAATPVETLSAPLVARAGLRVQLGPR